MKNITQYVLSLTAHARVSMHVYSLFIHSFINTLMPYHIIPKFIKEFYAQDLFLFEETK